MITPTRVRHQMELFACRSLIIKSAENGPRNGSAKVFSFSKNLATSCSALWGLGIIKSPHKPNLTRMVDVVKRRAQEHPCLFPNCTRMQRIRHSMHELLVLVLQQLANIAPFRFTAGFRRRKPIASFGDPNH